MHDVKKKSSRVILILSDQQYYLVLYVGLQYDEYKRKLLS